LRKRKALKIISAILLICALVFAAYEILKVRNITVSGCETISTENVITLSGLKKGESIFLVDAEKIRKALASDPYIAPVNVAVEYPDSVAITIKERKEAAYVIENGKALVIDDECYLLKILDYTTGIAYPMVSGLSLQVFNVGERLGASDAFQLDVLSEILVEAESSGMELKSLDVSIAADVVIDTGEGYKVELGDDTNLDYKFKLVKTSVDKLKELGKTGGIIDVASGAEGYYREK
jgi:cell division protein FtsQ